MEIMEFVQFLQNPDKFRNLGAKLPKGADTRMHTDARMCTHTTHTHTGTHNTPARTHTCAHTQPLVHT